MVTSMQPLLQHFVSRFSIVFLTFGSQQVSNLVLKSFPSHFSINSPRFWQSSGVEDCRAANWEFRWVEPDSEVFVHQRIELVSSRCRWADFRTHPYICCPKVLPMGMTFWYSNAPFRISQVKRHQYLGGQAICPQGFCPQGTFRDTPVLII